MKFNALFIGIFSTLPLLGCDSDSNNDPGNSNRTGSSAYNGVWDRQGYGELYQSLGNPTIENTDNPEKLSFRVIEDQVFKSDYSKLQILPQNCQPQNLLTDSSPESTAMFFANSFAEYYAFFNERGITWQENSDNLLQNINQNMSEQDLFLALAETIADIDDGHVMLSSNINDFRPVQARGANRIIEESFAEQSEFTDIQDYANSLSVKYSNALFSYFDEDSVEVIEGRYGPSFIAATINDGQVGYLSITNMAFLTSVEEGLDLTANIEAVDQIFAELFELFSSTESLIIDIRSNTGGMDEVALRMASYFFANQQQIGSKYAKTPLGDFNYQEAWIKPATDSPYLKPVVLITSEATASAAEVFTLAMKSLPQVTHIGETTAGMLSDVLEKQLPNGWDIWLANEVYQDMNGQVFEAIGIQPEKEITTFSLEAINSGKNPAIELAVGLLE